MRRSWTKELLGVLAAVLIVCVASAIVRTCFPEAAHGLKISGSQWQPLGPWDGGVNTAAIKSAVAPNQLIDAENFVWTPGGLEVREGFYRFASPQSGRPVEWLDIFKTTQGSSYLMYSDGEHLWYRPALIGAAVELNFGRSDSGRVNAYTGLPWVHGKTISGQKWRTALGTLEGGTITVDGVEKTIELVVLDTLVKVTEDFGGDLTNVDYNMDVASIDVGSGFQVSNNYWINTNVGKFYFSGPGQFTIVDSLTGVRYSYTAVRRKCNTTPVLEFTSAAVTTDFAGKFLRIVTNPFSAGGAANPVTSGHPFYMSYPIRESGGGKVTTWAPAFIPDSTAAQYFIVETLVYDSTTVDVVTADSIRLVAADSANFSCIGTSNALYLKVYAAELDSNDFLSGDWFFYPRFTFKAYNMTYDSAAPYSYLDLPTIAMKVFPVVGGFAATDGAILVAWPGLWTTMSRDDTTEYYIPDTNNVAVTFYRMKREDPPTAVGINWAVWHNGANFEVRSSYPDRIYWSEVNQPDSFLVDHVLIVDHGNALIAGGKQYGDLIVYTATNRWKIINGGGGAYGRQYMDGARGCIARGSFLDIDGMHYGLAADGFWESSGEAPVIISQAVESWFRDSLDYSRLDEIAAGYDAENNNIWISFPPNHTLVYNRDSRSWWPQSWRARAYAYNPDVTVSDTVRFIAGGVDSSTIFVRGGSDDDGDSIVAMFQTPYMDFGVPQLIKRWRGLRMGYEADRATAFELSSYRKFSGTAFDSFTGSLESGWSEKWLRLREGLYRGKNLSHRLTLYDASGLRISAAQVEVKAGGEE